MNHGMEPRFKDME